MSFRCSAKTSMASETEIIIMATGPQARLQWVGGEDRRDNDLEFIYSEI